MVRSRKIANKCNVEQASAAASDGANIVSGSKSPGSRKLLQAVAVSKQVKDSNAISFNLGFLPYALPSSTRFCGMDDQGNCDWGGYVEVRPVRARRCQGSQLVKAKHVCLS